MSSLIQSRTTDTIIKVENLSKRYILSHEAERDGRFKYQRFSDALTNAAMAPFRALEKNRAPSPAREEFWALKDVSFSVQRGDVIGIIGRNGAGKSTLLKILSRITEPTGGRIEINGRVASLLEVGTGFHPELTGRENIYLNGAVLGMSRREIRDKFDEIVSFAEVERFLDTPVKHYSSGMYVRLAFSVAAHLDPEILIVDEVLAVGDAQFQKKCLGKMKEVSDKEGRTVLFVSHNTGAIMNLCRRGLVFKSGNLICDLPVEKAVTGYFHSLAEEKSGTGSGGAHVLFEIDPADSSPAAVTRIEMLNERGEPMPVLHTWDTFVLRIWYRCERTVPKGAVEMHLNSFSGMRLCVLSSQPDSNFPLTFQPGNHHVDCVVEKIPFSAGTYNIDFGLTVPNVEWLWRKQNQASFTIHPKDVYASGKPPDSNWTLLAPIYHWKAGKP